MDDIKDLFCELPVVPLRAEPTHRAELVSQLLFGDRAQGLQASTDGKWWKVKLETDGYEGWADAKQLLRISPPDASGMNEISCLLSGADTYVTYADGHALRLPPGCLLPCGETRRLDFENASYRYTGDLRVPASLPEESLLQTVVDFFQHSPYLWGGKTPWGIDCSGFVQQVFRFFSFRLPRDAWQQAQHLCAVEGCKNPRSGNLLFFKNESGRVIHVGIALDDCHIVHAHGKVRVDKFDQSGIINSDTGLYSHSGIMQAHGLAKLLL